MAELVHDTARVCVQRAQMLAARRELPDELSMVTRRVIALHAAMSSLRAVVGRVPAVLFLLCLGLAAPASAGGKLHGGARVDVAYTSNLFKEQERRLPQFETDTAPGERYHRMEGPADVVTTPGLEAGVGWKAHKRETELSLGAEYAVHARNPIANYLELDLGAEQELTKRDTLALEMSLTPTRFKKNYAYADVAGTRLFARADYLAWTAALEYERRWAKRWWTSIEAAAGQKRFDDPFANRDENSFGGRIGLRHDPWKRLALELGFDAGATLTPGDSEFGIRIDRSRVDAEPSFEATLDLPRRFEVAAGVAHRIRSYTSDVRADGVHFDRVDRRWTLEGAVAKEFGETVSVEIGASFADSDADRQDPGEDPDEFGYQEFRVELGCEYRID